MPELAEVALYAQDLSALVKSRRVHGFSFPNRNDWGKTIVPAGIRRRLRASIGSKISFSSEGKSLFLEVQSGRNRLAEFRLGMTGRFQTSPPAGKWRRHCFLIIQFPDVNIYYLDPRRFGRVKGPRAREKAIGGFSPKAGFWLASSFSPPQGAVSSPRISWLLKHGEDVGVGNYMAIEALGRLKLSPFEPSKNLREAEKLLKKCADIAKKSFKCGGNSFGTGYYRLDGTEGGYARFCRYYQNGKVQRLVFRGRPVFTKYALPRR